MIHDAISPIKPTILDKRWFLTSKAIHDEIGLERSATSNKIRWYVWSNPTPPTPKHALSNSDIQTSDYYKVIFRFVNSTRHDNSHIALPTRDTMLNCIVQLNYDFHDKRAESFQTIPKNVKIGWYPDSMIAGLNKVKTKHPLEISSECSL